MAQFVSNTEVILTDTCLNISKSFDRFIPFQEETDFIEWISYNLTDKFSDFIVHFCHVDFDKDNNIWPKQSYSFTFTLISKSIFIIVIAGASLISFVFGLNANPQIAIVLLFILLLK